MTQMDQERIRELSDEATTVLLNKPGTESSRKGGWMMISTILIEAWDLYAIASSRQHHSSALSSSRS
jgi:hypothetical protein